jgi:hypothetical protein
MEFDDLPVSNAANDTGTHVERSAFTRRSSTLNDKDVLIASTHDFDVGRHGSVRESVDDREVRTDFVYSSEYASPYVLSRVDPYDVRRERRRLPITFTQIGVTLV